MIKRYPIPSLSDAYLMTLDAGTGSFPASRIQKGLVLALGDRDLSEEGLGFGLPVLKLGLRPIFPGSWRTTAGEHNGLCLIEADFEMSLRARMVRKGRIIDNGLFCLVWENLCRIHRAHPQLRKCMSISSRALKKRLELEEDFLQGPTLGLVRASYLIDDSGIDVELKFPRVDGCSELIVLNEQGANWFDTYCDSDGLVLKGHGIGSWNRCVAEHASFVDPSDGLAFTLKRVEGAMMFHGRELETDTLSWSGLAYVLPPDTEKFAYSIELSIK